MNMGPGASSGASELCNWLSFFYPIPYRNEILSVVCIDGCIAVSMRNHDDSTVATIVSGEGYNATAGCHNAGA